jgi:hypothetical protein
MSIDGMLSSQTVVDLSVQPWDTVRPQSQVLINRETPPDKVFGGSMGRAGNKVQSTHGKGPLIASDKGEGQG